MCVRRCLVALAVAFAFVACRDAAGPVTERVVPGPQFSRMPAAGIRMLEQSPSAPPLQTYRVSFWARHDRQSTVTVNYRSGQRFLRFRIPRFGLAEGPGDTRLRGSDSIRITLTIDPLKLSVDFQPSGVEFSKVLAPVLTLSYANANPDLNGDGEVDARDQTVEQLLGLWTQTRGAQRWLKLASKNDTMQEFVSARLYHFSEYALSW